MLPFSLVLGLCLVAVQAQYPNASTTLASVSQNQCCFVIQDRFSVNYWAHYVTSTWYGSRKVTFVVSTVTQYADTAITNYETQTTVKNTSFSTTFEVAENWVYASNAAPGPKLATTIISESTTSVYGTPVTSPAGFFVYPSVKIVNVPAITQANGELACTTRSTYFLNCSGIAANSATFSGINSHVQAYFGGLKSSTQTITSTYAFPQWSTLPLGSTYTQIQITNQSTYIQTQTATITNATHPSTTGYTTEIQFPTPYLHFPKRGQTQVFYTGNLPDIEEYTSSASGLEARDLPTTASSQGYDPLLANYGYVPQDAIEWMAEKYPSLASCLPGGPSILPIADHYGFINVFDDGCAWAAPAAQAAVPDLTESSGATVHAAGCFRPGNCPAVATSGPAPASAVGVVLPPSTTHPSTASREVPTSPSTQDERPAESSKVELNPLPNLVSIFGGRSTSLAFNPMETAKPATGSETPSESSIIEVDLMPNIESIFGGHSSLGFNPTETAKPATGSEPGVTVGMDTGDNEAITFSSSLDLPVIIIASPTIDSPSTGASNVFSNADHTFSLTSSASTVEISGQTLTRGSSATISGTLVFLSSAGLVVGSSTLPLPTPFSASAVEIAGHTLVAGSSAITVAGNLVSLGSAGFVIGDFTVPLPTSTTADGIIHTTQGLGGIIAGAFGPHTSTAGTQSAANFGNVTNVNPTSPLAFTGGTVKDYNGLAKAVGVLAMIAAWHVI